MTTPLTPFWPHCSMASFTTPLGNTITARSTGSGMSRMYLYALTPAIDRSRG